MIILIHFLLRVSFGMATAMAGTSPKQVTSGYYRNHLYVLLGFNVLASMVAVGRSTGIGIWAPITAAAFSYVGSVFWLYEKPGLGRLSLLGVAAASIIGVLQPRLGMLTEPDAKLLPLQALLQIVDPISGGLLLGITLAAMFLGHWYLNTPTMKMAPLQWLVAAMGTAVLLRAIVCGTGLALTFQYADPGAFSHWFAALRWLAGILGTAGVVGMTWQTLKIPNTQSATGILYVGVIVTFIGELASLLMSSSLPYPI